MLLRASTRLEPTVNDRSASKRFHGIPVVPSTSNFVELTLTSPDVRVPIRRTAICHHGVEWSTSRIQSTCRIPHIDCGGCPGRHRCINASGGYSRGLPSESYTRFVHLRPAILQRSGLLEGYRYFLLTAHSSPYPSTTAGVKIFFRPHCAFWLLQPKIHPTRVSSTPRSTQRIISRICTPQGIRYLPMLDGQHENIWTRGGSATQRSPPCAPPSSSPTLFYTHHG
jgi:hypothetical protein